MPDYTILTGSMRFGPSAQQFSFYDAHAGSRSGRVKNASGSALYPPDAVPTSGVPGTQPVAGGQQGIRSEKGRFDRNDCQTCKNRKYQDGSDDPGVSFKTPTKIDPKAVASAVRGHEQEHVVREQSKAQRENREVVYQNVSIHTGICPECGKVYVSGGTTRTATRAKNEDENPYAQMMKAQQAAEEAGKLDMRI